LVKRETPPLMFWEKETPLKLETPNLPNPRKYKEGSLKKFKEMENLPSSQIKEWLIPKEERKELP